MKIRILAYKAPFNGAVMKVEDLSNWRDVKAPQLTGRTREFVEEKFSFTRWISLPSDVAYRPKFDAVFNDDVKESYVISQERHFLVDGQYLGTVEIYGNPKYEGRFNRKLVNSVLRNHFKDAEWITFGLTRVVDVDTTLLCLGRVDKRRNFVYYVIFGERY